VVDPSTFTELSYSVSEGVALIKLNRPDRRNAWSGVMSVEYRWALHHADTDPGVHVVVLTGVGRDFCIGADRGTLDAIDERGGAYERTRAELPPFPEGTPTGFRHNHTVPLALSVPVIAAVNGACAGAGVVLATYADLRFGADTTKINTAFASLGLPAEYGIGWMLPRIMGTANAALLLYSARVIDGAEAHRLGWLQRVVPAAGLLDETLLYARDLARHSSPQSLRTMKRQIFVDAMGDVEDAYRRSVEDMNAALTHPDLREGLTAQRERRRPDFLPSP